MNVLRRVNRLALGLLALVLVGLAVGLPGLHFNNDLLALFPEARDFEGQQRAETLRSERVSRRLVLLLGSEDLGATREAARQLVAELNRCDCFEPAQLAADTDAREALVELYRAHWPLLLTPGDREALADGAAERARAVRRDLLTRPGPGLSERLTTDPLGTLENYLRWQRPPLGDLSLDSSGAPLVRLEGREYLLVQAQLTGSPYRIELQEQVGETLARGLAPLRALPGGEVIRTGTYFYARSGSDRARREVSTVGLGSLLGIAVLLLAVFRSPLLLATAAVPIAVGVATGAVVTDWLFGSVHVMALVFGAGLVGVAIDYSMHCFAHRQLAGPRWRVGPGMSALLVPLTLGMATSTLAYLSFTLAGFPGFNQIAVFSAAGLMAAYLVVVALYPHWLARPARRPLPPALVRGLARWRRRQWRLRRVPAAAWAVLALPAAVLVFWAPANDDIRRMQDVAPELRRDEARIREALGGSVALPYLLVSAGDRQQLLRRLEALEQPLAGAERAGEIEGYQSLAQYLPSGARQAANRALWRQWQAAGDLAPLIDLLAPAARERMLEQLTGEDWLAPEELLPRLSALPAPPLHFSRDQRHYAVVELRGPVIRDGLPERIRGHEGVVWVDPVARTNELLGRYRQTAGWLLLCAYGLILLCLWPRYGWRGALACVAPPGLASLGALAVLVVSGQALSVFNVMALLLVLGIGMDYTLFVRERRGRALGTLLAIGLSTLTTVLSFGLLSLSATAAIADFGLTLLLGMALCFVLVPLAQGAGKRVFDREDPHG